MKYSFEEKLKIVLTVLEKHQSIKSLSKETGIAKKSIRHWLAFYKEYGEKGLLVKKEKTVYSGEFKLSVLRYMHENHLSCLETAVKFGITHDATIYRWQSIYNERDVSGLFQEEQKELKEKYISQGNPEEQSKEDLIAENLYLRAENAYLKKLDALVQDKIALENKNKQKPSTN